MVDDNPEDTTPSPDSGRARRTPPTIDLEASEVSGETRNAGEDAQPEAAQPEPSSPEPAPAISPWVIAAVSGAVAASLVICVGWLLGWPAVLPTTSSTPPFNAAVIDDLAARVAGIEAKTSKPAAPAPDPAMVGRVEALEKSIASLRGDLSGLRAQSEKLTAAVNDVKSTPRESAPSVDLSAINERIAQVERATRAQASEIAQGSAKPADDVPLRRIVAASVLDVSVRQGESYAAALAAAKSLAENADALKPLDDFAATGVPSAASLSRELLTLVPKLSPAPENATSGSGIVDRLQAGAAKLVRIERTDSVGNDRGAVVARVTAAALRNDFAEARRELKTLAPADRAAAQAWLDKADARDTALAASRQFASEAMAALAKPRQ
ncbi:MAG TPA: hypothetical protein VNC42_06725 [Bradyrhizobium sp.]|jgi:hypothetical protein|nr:hypothetical protein [Bradyrhizobium sp.]